MKSESKIYNFFIIIALLFWNPISFYLLYKGTPVIDMRLLWMAYILIFIMGIISILLISKNKISRKVRDVILSLAFIGFILGIVIFVNARMGSDSESVSTEEGLVFPKNQNVKSKTLEYDYDIITNSLGLRDREISIEKGDQYRIMCFGDSWTVGFGVNVEDSWPRKLQGYLKDKEFDKVEVVNCGKGGQYTSVYLEHMKKAVPLLKPDVVLVGVLQIDDLAQLYEFNDINAPKNSAPKRSMKAELKKVLKTYAEHSFGNIMAAGNKSIDLKENSINSVKKKLKKYDYLQKKQYQMLPDSVRYMFESGNLNPGLLNMYVSSSYRTVVFNNPEHPVTKFAIEKMDQDIKEMKTLCEANNAKMVFVNMPTAIFTGHDVMRTPNDTFNEFLKENNGIDSIYQNIASKNNLPYIELTDHFKGLEDKTSYFFRFDGHPNQKGYNEIANFIGEELIKLNIIE